MRTFLVAALLAALALFAAGPDGPEPLAAPRLTPDAQPRLERAVDVVPAFPYTTFSGAVPDAVNSALGSCDGQTEVVAAWFEDKNKHRWGYMYDTSTHVIVFFYYAPPGELASHYAVARVDMSRPDVIPQLVWHTKPNELRGCNILTGARI